MCEMAMQGWLGVGFHGDGEFLNQIAAKYIIEREVCCSTSRTTPVVMLLAMFRRTRKIPVATFSYFLQTRF